LQVAIFFFSRHFLPTKFLQKCCNGAPIFFSKHINKKPLARTKMSDSNNDQDASSQPSSMDLFNKLLEEQLKREEERMKQGGSQVSNKPKIPFKPRAKKNETPTQDVQQQQQQNKQAMDINDDEVQQKTKEPKSASSSGRKSPRPTIQAETVVEQPPSAKKRKISSDNIAAQAVPANTNNASMGDQQQEASAESSTLMFEKMIEEQLKRENAKLQDQMGIDSSSANGALSQRLFDKNWKTRKEAYDELAGLFSANCDDRTYDEYTSSMGKIVQDKNAIALEAALPAVFNFVSHFKHAVRYV